MMKLNHFFFLMLVFLCLTLFLGCGGDSPTEKQNASEALTGEDKVVASIVESEEQILELTKRLERLTRALEGENQMGSRNIFCKTIQYQGPEPAPLDALLRQNGLAAESGDLQPFAQQMLPISAVAGTDSVNVWKNLLDQYKVADCRLGVLEGNFESADRFVMETSIEGRIVEKEKSKADEESNSGIAMGLNASQTLTWIVGENDRWQIESWIQKDFKLTQATRSVFADVLESAIPDEATRKLLTSSLHREKMVRQIRMGTMKLAKEDEHKPYEAHLDWPSSYQFPSVSVVDYNSDGWDDLYVMDRWGPSYLLKNNEGVFEDVTEASGLTVPNFVNCSLFDDFDNDGDVDAFVGRTVEPSLYFENVDGTFVKRLQFADGFFVVSASAADVNRDGLLDIYLNTYNGGTRKYDIRKMTQEEIEFAKRETSFIDRSGPENRILLNRGGNFEFAKLDDAAKQFRNTYQSVWSDFDNDGDPDLYVCNDFAPDAFLRNDTERMSFDIKFTDVSAEVFPDGLMGYGMGATWGDFDSNGTSDLYVSNMYSKAGKRIIKQVGEVDPRIEVSSKGNFLFRNEGGTFKQVAGKGEGDQHVSKVGWSFGGQFADFNNDGELDLYVPSGFFTAPWFASTKEDL